MKNFWVRMVLEDEMNRYKIIILSFVLLLFGFLVGYLVSDNVHSAKARSERIANAVEEAVDVNKEVKDFGKPALIYFFAKDCSSCKKFKPNWLYLKRKYKDKFNFVEIDVDNQMNAPLFMEFMVNVIPYVYIEDAPFRNRVFVNPLMYQFMPRFEDELNRYLEMREILKKGAA